MLTATARISLLHVRGIDIRARLLVPNEVDPIRFDPSDVGSFKLTQTRGRKLIFRRRSWMIIN